MVPAPVADGPLSGPSRVGLGVLGRKDSDQQDGLLAVARQQRREPQGDRDIRFHVDYGPQAVSLKMSHIVPVQVGRK